MPPSYSHENHTYKFTEQDNPNWVFSFDNCNQLLQIGHKYTWPHEFIHQNKNNNNPSLEVMLKIVNNYRNPETTWGDKKFDKEKDVIYCKAIEIETTKFISIDYDSEEDPEEIIKRFEPGNGSQLQGASTKIQWSIYFDKKENVTDARITNTKSTPAEKTNAAEAGSQHELTEMEHPDKTFQKGLDTTEDDQVFAFNGQNLQITDAAMTYQLNGIFGMPYQFSEIVDPVPLISKQDDGDDDTGSPQIYIEDKNHIGRKFNEKILSVAPLLFLTPGSPDYMKGYNSEIVRKMTGLLSGIMDNIDEETASSGFDDGRYYSFKGDFEAYCDYANLALRTLGLFLGIDGYEIPIPGQDDKTVHIGTMNIREFFKDTPFSKRMGTLPFIGFYVDASDSITESFGNGTTESSLSSLTNGFSARAREVQFLLGNNAKNILMNVKQAGTEALQKFASSVGDFAEVFAEGSMIPRLTNELTTIITGGKIVFPEIWSDSSYSKTYDINLKLRSPDPDPVSIFLNIFMPIILLVSMAAPRQRGNSSNSFKSPFLVRAVYKSMFCCDLGIIDSIQITRGGDYRWNKLGLPLSADVNVSIKDLYHTMFISRSLGLMSNTAQLDYLSNMAGMNILEEEFYRNLKVLKLLVTNKPADLVRNFVYGLQERVVRRVTRFGEKFWLGSNIAN